MRFGLFKSSTLNAASLLVVTLLASSLGNANGRPIPKLNAMEMSSIRKATQNSLPPFSPLSPGKPGKPGVSVIPPCGDPTSPLSPPCPDGAIPPPCDPSIPPGPTNPCPPSPHSVRIPPPTRVPKKSTPAPCDPTDPLDPRNPCPTVPQPPCDPLNPSDPLNLCPPPKSGKTGKQVTVIPPPLSPVTPKQPVHSKIPPVLSPPSSSLPPTTGPQPVVVTKHGKGAIPPPIPALNNNNIHPIHPVGGDVLKTGKTAKTVIPPPVLNNNNIHPQPNILDDIVPLQPKLSPSPVFIPPPPAINNNEIPQFQPIPTPVPVHKVDKIQNSLGDDSTAFEYTDSTSQVPTALIQRQDGLIIEVYVGFDGQLYEIENAERYRVDEDGAFRRVSDNELIHSQYILSKLRLTMAAEAATPVDVELAYFEAKLNPTQREIFRRILTTISGGARM